MDGYGGHATQGGKITPREYIYTHSNGSRSCSSSCDSNKLVSVLYTLVVVVTVAAAIIVMW